MEKIEVTETVDPAEVPTRIAIFPKRVPARFENEIKPQKLVMTFPNLIIREVICFQLIVIVLTIVALFINAPLEELANPQHTPNPAKAPWYFVGLQELIHSFPPLLAGVIIPLVIIVALIIIPYFEINIKREGLWVINPKQMLMVLSTIVIAIVALTIPFHVFSVAIPTFLMYCIMLIPYFIKRDNGWIHWLAKRSITEWIMTWFVLIATVLTLIGSLFRGPGWSWVWPWQ